MEWHETQDSGNNLGFDVIIYTGRQSGDITQLDHAQATWRNRNRAY